MKWNEITKTDTYNNLNNAEKLEIAKKYWNQKIVNSDIYNSMNVAEQDSLLKKFNKSFSQTLSQESIPQKTGQEPDITPEDLLSVKRDKDAKPIFEKPFQQPLATVGDVKDITTDRGLQEAALFSLQWKDVTTFPRPELRDLLTIPKAFFVGGVRGAESKSEMIGLRTDVLAQDIENMSLKDYKYHMQTTYPDSYGSMAISLTDEQWQKVKDKQVKTLKSYNKIANNIKDKIGDSETIKRWESEVDEIEKRDVSIFKDPLNSILNTFVEAAPQAELLIETIASTVLGEVATLGTTGGKAGLLAGWANMAAFEGGNFIKQVDPLWDKITKYYKDNNLKTPEDLNYNYKKLLLKYAQEYGKYSGAVEYAGDLFAISPIKMVSGISKILQGLGGYSLRVMTETSEEGIQQALQNLFGEKFKDELSNLIKDPAVKEIVEGEKLSQNVLQTMKEVFPAMILTAGFGQTIAKAKEKIRAKQEQKVGDVIEGALAEDELIAAKNRIKLTPEEEAALKIKTYDEVPPIPEEAKPELLTGKEIKAGQLDAYKDEINKRWGIDVATIPADIVPIFNEYFRELKQLEEKKKTSDDETLDNSITKNKHALIKIRDDINRLKDIDNTIEEYDKQINRLSKDSEDVDRIEDEINNLELEKKNIIKNYEMLKPIGTEEVTSAKEVTQKIRETGEEEGIEGKEEEGLRVRHVAESKKEKEVKPPAEPIKKKAYEDERMIALSQKIVEGKELTKEERSYFEDFDDLQMYGRRLTDEEKGIRAHKFMGGKLTEEEEKILASIKQPAEPTKEEAEKVQKEKEIKSKRIDNAKKDILEAIKDGGQDINSDKISKIRERQYGGDIFDEAVDLLKKDNKVKIEDNKILLMEEEGKKYKKGDIVLVPKMYWNSNKPVRDKSGNIQYQEKEILEQKEYTYPSGKKIDAIFTTDKKMYNAEQVKPKPLSKEAPELPKEPKIEEILIKEAKRFKDEGDFLFKYSTAKEFYEVFAKKKNIGKNEFKKIIKNQLSLKELWDKAHKKITEKPTPSLQTEITVPKEAREKGKGVVEGAREITEPIPQTYKGLKISSHDNGTIKVIDITGKESKFTNDDFRKLVEDNKFYDDDKGAISNDRIERPIVVKTGKSWNVGWSQFSEQKKQSYFHYGQPILGKSKVLDNGNIVIAYVDNMYSPTSQTYKDTGKILSVEYSKDDIDNMGLDYDKLKKSIEKRPTQPVDIYKQGNVDAVYEDIHGKKMEADIGRSMGSFSKFKKESSKSYKKLLINTGSLRVSEKLYRQLYDKILKKATEKPLKIYHKYVGTVGDITRFFDNLDENREADYLFRAINTGYGLNVVTKEEALKLAGELKKGRIVGHLRGDMRIVPVPQTAEWQLAKKIAEKLGRKLIAFDTIEGLGGQQVGNKVLITLDSANPTLEVLGHEMMHSFSESHPVAYQELLDFVQENELPDKVKMIAEKSEYYTKDLIPHEVLSDYAGKFFINKDFQRKLFAKNKPLYIKIYDFFKNILDKIKDLFGKRSIAEANFKKLGQRLEKFYKSIPEIEIRKIKSTNVMFNKQVVDKSRNNMIARIHILAKEVGFETDKKNKEKRQEWEDYIFNITGKDSSAKMTPTEHFEVIRSLELLKKMQKDDRGESTVDAKSLSKNIIQQKVNREVVVNWEEMRQVSTNDRYSSELMKYAIDRSKRLKGTKLNQEIPMADALEKASPKSLYLFDEIQMIEDEINMIQEAISSRIFRKLMDTWTEGKNTLSKITTIVESFKNKKVTNVLANYIAGNIKESEIKDKRIVELAKTLMEEAEIIKPYVRAARLFRYMFTGDKQFIGFIDDKILIDYNDKLNNLYDKLKTTKDPARIQNKINKLKKDIKNQEKIVDDVNKALNEFKKIWAKYDSKTAIKKWIEYCKQFDWGVKDFYYPTKHEGTREDIISRLLDRKSKIGIYKTSMLKTGTSEELDIDGFWRHVENGVRSSLKIMLITPKAAEFLTDFSADNRRILSNTLMKSWAGEPRNIPVAIDILGKIFSLGFKSVLGSQVGLYLSIRNLQQNIAHLSYFPKITATRGFARDLARRIMKIYKTKGLSAKEKQKAFDNLFKFTEEESNLLNYLSHKHAIQDAMLLGHTVFNEVPLLRNIEKLTDTFARQYQWSDKINRMIALHMLKPVKVLIDDYKAGDSIESLFRKLKCMQFDHNTRAILASFLAKNTQESKNEFYKYYIKKKINDIHYDYSRSGRPLLLQHDIGVSMLGLINYPLSNISKNIRMTRLIKQNRGLRNKFQVARALGQVLLTIDLKATIKAIVKIGVAAGMLKLLKIGGDDDEEKKYDKKQIRLLTNEFYGIMQWIVYPHIANNLVEGITGRPYNRYGFLESVVGEPAVIGTIGDMVDLFGVIMSDKDMDSKLNQIVDMTAENFLILKAIVDLVGALYQSRDFDIYRDMIQAKSFFDRDKVLKFHKKLEDIAKKDNKLWLLYSMTDEGSRSFFDSKSSMLVRNLLFGVYGGINKRTKEAIRAKSDLNACKDLLLAIDSEIEENQNNESLLKELQKGKEKYEKLHEELLKKYYRVASKVPVVATKADLYYNKDKTRMTKKEILDFDKTMMYSPSKDALLKSLDIYNKIIHDLLK